MELIRENLVLIVAVGGVFFLLLGYLTRKYMAERKIKSAERTVKDILQQAEKEAEAKKKESALEAKDKLYQMRSKFDQETRSRRQELQRLEKKLSQKEANLDRKVDVLEKKERETTDREKGIALREKATASRERELNSLLDEEKEKLQNISSLSREEAKKMLLAKMEDEVKYEATVMLKRIEEETRQTAAKKAKEIITQAIERCAAEHTVELTVSSVALPSDEMKGRVIGREGRNIRAFETATAIDVIVDDTPEAVILSGFDSVRREIARIAMERLVTDGRIHPGRIEEVVAKVTQEMEVTIREEGEKATFDVGVHSLHPEEIRLLGRLKYRTSYGQNVLQHSKEVAYIAGLMAGELGLDVQLAKRVGLLHDIGKAADHDVEGTHARIGADIARRHNESPAVVEAIDGHHGGDEQSIMAVLVQAADAISAARPGIRRETLETYVKRLDKLEKIADSFDGVEKSYAIQAGREIRVMVQPDKVTDAEAVALARQISKKIESELEYPGQIKLTLIRETRAVDYAK